MRKIHVLFCLSFFLMFGCLEDEGNYDYKDMKEPQWFTDQFINVWASEHDVMKLRGHDYFTWETDSLQREGEVQYEWKLNDVVLSTEADVDLQVDSVLKWANITKLSNGSSGWQRGSFTIIDKELGTCFMNVVNFFIMPYRSSGDWYVLTEEAGESNCFFIKKTYNREERKNEFELQDSFDDLNGASIPGKPIFLGYTRTAKNVGPLGSVTIMTDKVAYEVDAATFKLHSDIKDLFEGGAPGNFSPVARVDAWEADHKSGLSTFLANADGKLYQRQLSKNNLGGKFMNIPYELDEKGYKITKFGDRQYGYSPIPCWDEKNNRVVMISFDYKSSGMPWDPSYMATSMITLKNNSSMTDCPPVWGFENGSKVLGIGFQKGVMVSFSLFVNLYTVIYNDASGKTWCGEFMMNPTNGSLIQSAPGMPPFSTGGDSRIVECPVQIPGDALVVTSCSGDNAKARSQVLYTDGNKVNYLNLSDDYASKSLITDFSERITYIGYGTAKNGGAIASCDLLVVGGENGTLSFYDIANRDRPICVKTMNFNGKIVMAKELVTEISGVNEY
ncbi:PKD-like family lipoprotein [Butyricimonas paravirosa]